MKRARYECRLPLPDMPPTFVQDVSGAPVSVLRDVRDALLRAAKDAPDASDRGRASAYAEIITIALSYRR